MITTTVALWGLLATASCVTSVYYDVALTAFSDIAVTLKLVFKPQSAQNPVDKFCVHIWVCECVEKRDAGCSYV